MGVLPVEPYRGAAPPGAVHAPDFGWTRWVSGAATAAGALAAVAAIVGLLLDKDCDGKPSPHVWAALSLAVLAPALAAGGVFAHRGFVRAWRGRVRVRSRAGSFAWGALSLWPVVLALLANVCLAWIIYFVSTFDLCFNINPSGAGLWLGC